jgi:hypothetical protein
VTSRRAGVALAVRHGMGDAIDDITRAGQRNREEGRVINIQAVFERSSQL